MTIPHKKSRLIEVNSIKYRWLISGGKSNIIGQSSPSIHVIIQKDGESSNKVLRALLSSKHYVGEYKYVGDHKISVTPKDIIKIIKAGIEAGWEPTKNSLDLEDVKLLDWTIEYLPNGKRTQKSLNLHLSQKVLES